MTRLIPQNQLAGLRDQVLDSHQAVADLRQALSYPNYMQTANQCAAIGVETLGVGGIVCALLVSGAVASATGTKGSEIGGEIGEKIYEFTQP